MRTEAQWRGGTFGRDSPGSLDNAIKAAKWDVQCGAVAANILDDRGVLVATVEQSEAGPIDIMLFEDGNDYDD
jgi:hypothetical protein